jgi:hypothetical protein
MTVTFTDDLGNLSDPLTVKFRVISPSGRETSMTYTVDADLGRSAQGMYYADITPTEGGRWFLRWETTGATFAIEENFIVQVSPFVDGRTGYA